MEEEIVRNPDCSGSSWSLLSGAVTKGESKELGYARLLLAGGSREPLAVRTNVQPGRSCQSDRD